MIYPNDHNPPHVHIVWGEHKLVVEIESGNILAGEERSARVLREAIDWVSENRRFAMAKWAEVVERDEAE